LNDTSGFAGASGPAEFLGRLRRAPRSLRVRRLRREIEPSAAWPGSAPGAGRRFAFAFALAGIAGAFGAEPGQAASRRW